MRPNWFFAFPIAGDFVLALPPVPTHFRSFHPEDVHLTLAFLGGVTEEAARRGLAVLDERLGAGALSRVEVRLDQVVPMGPKGAYSALSALLGDGREAMTDAISALENPLLEAAAKRSSTRPPKPHVTIARPRRRAGSEERRAGLEWAASLELGSVRATLDRVALYTWSEKRSERLFRIVAERPL
jgi:2'-5' RNA ligase